MSPNTPRTRKHIILNSGAEFQSYENRWLVDDSPIYRAIDTSLDPQKAFGDIGVSHYLGMDAGFSEDGFAIAISHYEHEYVEIPENFMKEVHAYYPELIKEIEDNEGKLIKPVYVLDYYEVFYPGKPPLMNNIRYSQLTLQMGLLKES
jgi:hypothetical protein